eukprot:TRINITY_DN19950_c0_g1_i1.p1 TRINITY_DN19950_c0_g1~~TRINITY_DN19950_c0_g1_i1.p1  ORF type:complete len:1886 (-),score=266.67 TRINITY_DN19950_c0_g1_i1:178-5217(-)
MEVRDQLNKELPRTTDKRLVLTLMRRMNYGLKVTPREAGWVLAKVDSFDCRTAEEELLALHLCMAYWYMQDAEESAENALLRAPLIERLELEYEFGLGVVRLCNFFSLFLIFLFTLLHLAGAGNDVLRGIQINLETKFQLAELSSITAFNELSDFVQQFSTRSTPMSPLSVNYFSSQAWVLQAQSTTFQQPEQLRELDMPFTDAMTLQAWIKADQLAMTRKNRVGLPILRKALGHFEEKADHSCWSWNFPPSISYGAHDYGGGEVHNQTNLAEEFVEANYRVPVLNGISQYPESDEMVLHTVVINLTHAVFMKNAGEQIDVQMLPRPVTDCDSNELLLGSQGLTLSSVRYFPRQLTSFEVHEIYRGGAILSSIAYVTPPQTVEAVKQDDQVLRMIERQESYLTKELEKFSKTVDYNAALGAQAVANKKVDPEPMRSNHHDIKYVPQDPTLKLPFWQIYDKPVYTDVESNHTAPASALPSDRGFTISSWLKFDDSGHGYHMAMAMPLLDETKNWESQWTGWDNYCWMIYAGASWTSFHTKSTTVDESGGQRSGPELMIFDKQAPESWRFGGKSYRHMVWIANPEDAEYPLKICIDGKCNGHPSIDDYAKYTNKDRSFALNCSATGIVRNYSLEQQAKANNESLIFFNRRPKHDYSMTAWQMSTKYFNRALTDEEVAKLFKSDPLPGEVGKTIKKAHGCKVPAETTDDRAYRDSFGHDCLWYYASYLTHPYVCARNPEAAAACPVACLASETCWGSTGKTSSEPHLTIWPMQIEFRSKGKWGTTCVAKSTTPEHEAIECALNAPNWPTPPKECNAAGISCGPKDCREHEADRSRLLQCLGDTTWVSRDMNTYMFLPCRDIIELNEPTCAWDDSMLADVAQRANANNAWSISFWFETLSTVQCAVPQIRLLGGEGNMFGFVSIDEGLFADNVNDGDCPEDLQRSEWQRFTILGKKEGGLSQEGAAADIPGQRSKAGDKHFILFGRTSDNQVGFQLDSHANFDQSRASAFPTIPPDKSFLRVINVMGNIRMTPWKVYPYYPTPDIISNWQYTERRIQEQKRGPAVPLAEQIQHKIERETSVFSEKIMVLAPPLIMQTRAVGQDCASAKIDQDGERIDIAKVLYDRGEEEQCSAPFTCPDYTPQFYTCTEDTVDGYFFGMPSEMIDGELQYVEYLSSIADSTLLGRNTKHKTTVSTSDFIDANTIRANIVGLFYTAQYDIISKLEVKFGTGSGRVAASYEVKHLVPILDTTQRFVGLMCLCMVLNCFWVFTATSLLRQTYKLHRKTWSEQASAIELLIDVGDVVFSVVFLVLIVVTTFDRTASQSTVQTLLSSILTLEKKPVDMMVADEFLRERKLDFLNQLNVVSDKIASGEQLGTFLMYAAMALLMRVVMATSAHPRIALITKTLWVAASDLTHFVIMFTLVFFGFAVIGTWRFGSERPDMARFYVAFNTMFDAMIGPPGEIFMSDAANEAGEYFVFALSFHVICFFFMLNFILAIIIDSYTTVIEGLRDSDIEQDIFTDIYCTCVRTFLSYRHQWPNTHCLTSHLRNLLLDSKFVTAEQLHWDGEVFNTIGQARSFVRHYQTFPFLVDVNDPENCEPPTIDDVATFQCLTLQKLESLSQTVQRAVGSDTSNAQESPDRSVGVQRSRLSSVSGSPVSVSPPSPPSVKKRESDNKGTAQLEAI